MENNSENSLKHLAIILDGNGRWAKKRGMPRTYGHTVGAKNVEVICRAAYNLGIKYLTLYAFSTENWKRPETEVSTIMKLLAQYLNGCIDLARENNMRVRLIGDISGIPQNLADIIKKLEDESKDYDGLQLNVAINYGGRDEIIRAVKRIKDDEGISSGDITEELITSHLDTGNIPDPDLLIRTGGDMRISNFLLWQLSYTELMFIDKAWPDFDEETLIECVEDFNNRNRRFGNV